MPADEATPAEAQGRDLLLRGVRVHYQEMGTGPTLLLLHDVFADHRAWRRVMPRLAQRFRVIAPDLPGFGASEKPTRYGFTREAFAETLCDLLAGVGAARAYVAGHALGAGVALTLAADHPEIVDRLALMHAASAPAERSLGTRLPGIPLLGSLVFKQWYGRGMFHAHFRREVFAPGYQYDRATVDAWYEQFYPPEARECAWRTVQRAVLDVSALGPKLAKVRAPTVVMSGDRARPASQSLAHQMMREIRGARWELVTGAASGMWEEQPDAVVDALERYLLG
jgi:pimeloyl-ACP methyl ester carboxylesterase